MSRRFTDQKFIDWCKRDYSGHVILAQRDGFFTVGQPGTSNLMSDVIVGMHLVISGDGPDLIVRGGPAGIRARLDWFATSELDYLADKVVACRHSDVRCGWDWDADLARAEFKENLAADKEPESVFDEFLEEHPDAFNDCHAMWTALSDVDRLEDTRYGEYPSTDVAQSRELVRKLVKLLEEQDEERARKLLRGESPEAT